MIEDIEKFKYGYQRSLKDQDFEINRRRLALYDDEHTVNLQKDRQFTI